MAVVFICIHLCIFSGEISMKSLARFVCFLLLSCPTRNLRPDLRPHCPSVLDHHPHPVFLSWKTAPHPSNRSLRAVLNLLSSHPKNSLLAQPSGSPRRRNSKSVLVFRRRPNELIPNLNPSPRPTRPQPASPLPSPTGLFRLPPLRKQLPVSGSLGLCTCCACCPGSCSHA